MHTSSYTVSEINSNINHILTSNFSRISIEGEISSYKVSPNGHVYFSLVDKNSELSCMMFNSDYINNEELIKAGKKVVISGTLGIYSPRGQYQFKAYTAKLLGEGELWKKFEILKEKLEKEGLFDDTIKKYIPRYLKEVVVVTSLHGSVKDDILKIIKKRCDYQNISIYPVSVQGHLAADSIKTAILNINMYMSPDVIIIARGGGSIEDLWSFNDEQLARAIYDSSIPIISAVGHETDFTICDFVSDKRASTPSDAAEMVSINKEEVIQYIDELQLSLDAKLNNKTLFYKEVISNLENQKIIRDPLAFIDILREKIVDVFEKLKYRVDNIVVENRNYLNSFKINLNNLNPYNVINRGYSLLINQEGLSISSINQVKKGDRIYSKIKDGKLEMEVLNKNEVKE